MRTDPPDLHARLADAALMGALVGRREALTEARDIAASYERDAAECLAEAQTPDRATMRERQVVARKIREEIENLANAPTPCRPHNAPMPANESEIRALPNVFPIGGPRRRK